LVGVKKYTGTLSLDNQKKLSLTSTFIEKSDTGVWDEPITI